MGAGRRCRDVLRVLEVHFLALIPLKHRDLVKAQSDADARWASEPDAGHGLVVVGDNDNEGVTDQPAISSADFGSEIEAGILRVCSHHGWLCEFSRANPVLSQCIHSAVIGQLGFLETTQQAVSRAFFASVWQTPTVHAALSSMSPLASSRASAVPKKKWFGVWTLGWL